MRSILKQQLRAFWPHRHGNAYGAHARCEIRHLIRQLRQLPGLRVPA
jgi:hypothetical protein